MAITVHIRKQLKDFELKVDFDLESGCMGLLGASGCGKSMTLKCIAGIETPDSGRITLNGRVLFDSGRKINVSPQKRKVGYLFQQYALFPHMTVRQNVEAGLSGTGKNSPPGRRRTSTLPACWNSSIYRSWQTHCQDDCPAVSSSGSPWRESSLPIRISCFWMSHFPPWTAIFGSSFCRR